MGDPDQGKLDQSMLNNALAEYQKIVQIDPKDTESLSMLARLYRVAKDEQNAEKTYKAILAVDPNDDDALTGLASLYADKGDMDAAIAVLKDPAEKNPDPQKVTTLAELYENAKQFSLAADQWKAALPLTNDNVQVRRHYAACLQQANRADEAIKAFQDLSNDNPKDTEILGTLLDLYMQKRDFANAHAVLAKIQAVKPPNDTAVKIAEAELLNAEGKTAQAIPVLENVLAQTRKTQYNDDEKQERIRMLSTLSDWQRLTGKGQDAIGSLKQIAEIDPRTGPTVEAKVVDVYIAAKDFKMARQQADAALKKYPGNRVVTLEHATLLGQLGETEAAVKEFRSLPNADQDRDILVLMARVQEQGKRFADEVKTLDSAEALSKTEPEKQAIIFQRGAMFEREKSYDQAEREFRKVIQSDPNNAEALNYLGYMFADQNMRLSEAQDLIKRALDLEPNNYAFLDSMGWVYYRMNKLDDAERELTRSIQIESKDPTIHDHLGDVYFKEGKLKEAIAQWQSSVQEAATTPNSDVDSDELAKLQKKLDSARVKLAKEQAPKQ
jgi:tetratricopeptide (TPR) repeat protein